MSKPQSLNDQVRSELYRRGLPDPPEGEIRRARYVSSTQDWYVLINEQWFYIGVDRQSAGWSICPYGPIDL